MVSASVLARPSTGRVGLFGVGVGRGPGSIFQSDFEVFFAHLFVCSFLLPFLCLGVNGSLSVHKLRQEVSSPSGAGIGLRGLSGVEAISTLTSFTPLK